MDLLDLHLHINRLTKAQLRRARACATICILLLTLAQGMTGYLLVKCYHNPSAFNKEYSLLSLVNANAQHQTKIPEDVSKLLTQYACLACHKADAKLLPRWNVFISHFLNALGVSIPP